MRLLFRAFRHARTGLRLAPAALILTTLIVALVASGSACSEGSQPFTVLMGSVPENSSHFTYWAADDLAADEDLWDIYAKFKKSSEADQMKAFVPVLASIQQAARVTSHDNSTLSGAVALFYSDFDAKYIEGQLEANGYSLRSPKEAGIWIPRDSQVPGKSVALRGNTLLMGSPSDLTACVDVTTKDKILSLAEDPSIRLLASRLPNGVIVEINRAVLSGERYADLVAYGGSYKKATGGMLKFTAAYMFRDPLAAGGAQQDIRDDLQMAFNEVKIKRDGNYVIATSRISVSDFAESLDF